MLSGQNLSETVILVPGRQYPSITDTGSREDQRTLSLGGASSGLTGQCELLPLFLLQVVS